MSMKPDHEKTEVAGRAVVDEEATAAADATRRTVRTRISRPYHAMLLGRATVFFSVQHDAVMRQAVRVVLHLLKETARRT